MINYVLVEGDRITGSHTNLAQVKKWADEIEAKKHINCFIYREIKR